MCLSQQPCLHAELHPLMGSSSSTISHASALCVLFVLPVPQAFLSGPITDDLQDCYDQLLDRMEQVG